WRSTRGDGTGQRRSGSLRHLPPRTEDHLRERLRVLALQTGRAAPLPQAAGGEVPRVSGAPRGRTPRGRAPGVTRAPGDEPILGSTAGASTLDRPCTSLRPCGADGISGGRFS